MSRQLRVEPEVRGPGGVDDQRHPVVMRRVSQPGDVADGSDVPRVPDEHRARVRVVGQRAAYGPGRDAEREPGGGVDLGPHPHRR